MAAKPNLLGNDDDAVVCKHGQTSGVLMTSGRTEVANEVADVAAPVVTPRGVAAVPETRRAEQAALLRPKVTATSWHGPR
jgi:hypothetical protein